MSEAHKDQSRALLDAADGLGHFFGVKGDLGNEDDVGSSRHALLILLNVPFAMVGGIAALWVICHSAFGMTLVAVRENSVRTGFIGVDRLMAQVIGYSDAVAILQAIRSSGVLPLTS